MDKPPGGRRAGANRTGAGRSLLEQPGREIVETAAPRQPLMRRAGRLEIYVVNSGVRQLLAEVLCPGPFHGPDSEEQDLHFLVELVRIGERAPAGRFRIEGPSATAAASAETAEIREFYQVFQACFEGLAPPPRHPRQGGVPPPGLPAKRWPHHRDQIGKHHLGEDLTIIPGEPAAAPCAAPATSAGRRDV